MHVSSRNGTFEASNCALLMTGLSSCARRSRDTMSAMVVGRNSLVARNAKRWSGTLSRVLLQQVP